MHGTEARQQHDRTADVVAGTRAILTMPRLNDCDAAKLAYIALWCEAGGRAGKVDWTKAQWAAACDRSTKCVSRWLESLERAGAIHVHDTRRGRVCLEVYDPRDVDQQVRRLAADPQQELPFDADEQPDEQTHDETSFPDAAGAPRPMTSTPRLALVAPDPVPDVAAAARMKAQRPPATPPDEAPTARRSARGQPPTTAERVDASGTHYRRKSGGSGPTTAVCYESLTSKRDLSRHPSSSSHQSDVDVLVDQGSGGSGPATATCHSFGELADAIAGDTYDADVVAPRLDDVARWLHKRLRARSVYPGVITNIAKAIVAGLVSRAEFTRLFDEMDRQGRAIKSRGAYFNKSWPAIFASAGLDPKTGERDRGRPGGRDG